MAVYYAVQGVGSITRRCSGNELALLPPILGRSGKSGEPTQGATFDFVREILWCYHWDKTSLVVLLHVINRFFCTIMFFFWIFFTAFCPLGSKRINSLWGASNYGSLPSIHLLLGYFFLSSGTSFSRITKTARQRAPCCRSAAAPVVKRGEKNLRGEVNVKFNIFLR